MPEDAAPAAIPPPMSYFAMVTSSSRYFVAYEFELCYIKFRGGSLSFDVKPLNLDSSSKEEWPLKAQPTGLTSQGHLLNVFTSTIRKSSVILKYFELILY